VILSCHQRSTEGFESYSSIPKPFELPGWKLAEDKKVVVVFETVKKIVANDDTFSVEFEGEGVIQLSSPAQYCYDDTFRQSRYCSDNRSVITWQWPFKPSRFAIVSETHLSSSSSPQLEINIVPSIFRLFKRFPECLRRNSIRAITIIKYQINA